MTPDSLAYTCVTHRYFTTSSVVRRGLCNGSRVFRRNATDVPSPGKSASNFKTRLWSAENCHGEIKAF